MKDLESNAGYRCGFVAVTGRPNVGKSTLINALVGTKVSIVSPKPQTTRHRILGVHTANDRQVIFVDTPGLHVAAGKAMNRMMNRTAISASGDADAVLFVTEAAHFTPDDASALRRIQDTVHTSSVLAVLNKVDRVRDKTALLEKIAQMSKRHSFAEIVPVSARNGDNMMRLLEVVTNYLPESPPLFAPGMRTDRNDEFVAAELVREKLTILLHEELPYGLTVQVERFDDQEEQLLIDAVIWVERASQKGIVIGKGGQTLKQVGQRARKDLLRHFGRRVHLELWVKVKKNWADSDAELRKLGYEASSE